MVTIKALGNVFQFLIFRLDVTMLISPIDFRNYFLKCAQGDSRHADAAKPDIME